MVDFKKSLKTGLAAHSDAAAKRREIQAVVDEMSEAIGAATSNLVGIKLHDSTREKVRQLAGYLATLGGSTKEVTQVRYTALSAQRLLDPKMLVELAEFEITPTGYPVYVSSSAVNGGAHDRASLEALLAELLEHPDTGGTMQRLVSAKPKEP